MFVKKADASRLFYLLHLRTFKRSRANPILLPG
jgi:hypothetical protein